MFVKTTFKFNLFASFDMLVFMMYCRHCSLDWKKSWLLKEMLMSNE